MNFKLVHFSERLLEDYLNLINKGKVRMPETSQLKNAGVTSKRLFSERSLNFLQTEESVRNKLRFIFD